MKMKLFMDDIIHDLRAELVEGIVVDRKEWQGKTDDRPMTRVREIHDVHFKIPVYVGQIEWANQVKPNMPWAEDHFLERISGQPLNPGKQYKNWPWYQQGVEEHKVGGKFSHTYMERFWPVNAADRELDESRSTKTINYGIHFVYGDLNSLVELLEERPFTRQAYLPIWFPEDLTAANQGERVPCTLGYHFQAIPSTGGNTLNITYNMRSCDFYRYLRDDVYMAGRLLQLVANETKMHPGKLTVNIANLHIFADESERLESEHIVETQRRLSNAF